MTTTASLTDIFSLNPLDWNWRKIKPFTAAEEGDTAVPRETRFQRSQYSIGQPAITTETKPRYVEDQLRGRVLSVSLPKWWLEEGAPPPMIGAKEKGADEVEDVYKFFGLIPEKVSATVEGGVFLKYFDRRTQNSLVIEIYNDLKVAAIVTRGKGIIASADVNNNEDLARVITKFKSP